MNCVNPNPIRIASQRLVRELKDIKEAARADKAKRFSKASE